MKRKIPVIILSVVLLINLYGCTREVLYSNISDEIYIDLPGPLDCNVDYGGKDGFHGDGTVIARFKYNSDSSEKIVKQINNNDKWNELPLSENIDILLYGGIKNGIEYTFDYATELNLPRIEHGYYFVHNRYYETQDEYSDYEILDDDAYAFNLTVAVYDTDANVLYYIKIDT